MGGEGDGACFSLIPGGVGVKRVAFWHRGFFFKASRICSDMLFVILDHLGETALVNMW